MRFVVAEGPSASDMVIKTGAIPSIEESQVLIRVHAAGINRPDILQRSGLYPPPSDASPIMGLEVAGEVIACGSAVTRWRTGDKVCALVNGGGYADYVVAPAAQCLPHLNNFSLIQAAALPETFFTVWHNLFQRAALTRGETLLVHGGSSGIGTCAIQLGVAFGVTVFATAGSSEKCDAVTKLGATAINYHEQDFVTFVKNGTEGKGADVILDMVGGDYVQRNFSAAAKDGRIVNIAFVRGSKISIDLTPLMMKRLVLTGSTLRAQSAESKAKIARELEKNVWPLLNAGKIKPIIDSVYPFEQIVEAHRRMESGQHIGKIMLDFSR